MAAAPRHSHTPRLRRFLFADKQKPVKQYPCGLQAEKCLQAARNVLASFQVPTAFRQRRGWAGCVAQSGKSACGSLFLQTARLRASCTGSSRLFDWRALQALIRSFRDASARTDSRRFSWRVATTVLPRDIARPPAALLARSESERHGSRIKSGMTEEKSAKQYPCGLWKLFGPQAARNMLACPREQALKPALPANDPTHRS